MRAPGMSRDTSRPSHSSSNPLQPSLDNPAQTRRRRRYEHVPLTAGTSVCNTMMANKVWGEGDPNCDAATYPDCFKPLSVKQFCQREVAEPCFSSLMESDCRGAPDMIECVAEYLYKYKAENGTGFVVRPSRHRSLCAAATLAAMKRCRHPQLGWKARWPQTFPKTSQLPLPL